ncbi:MAG: pyridoxal-phosphate dependent enzyme [Patescibacteria group bacterium]|nr:pyridoxal-phosphate dependent enzyme [Patescibacteria group bacterium]
MSDRVHVPHRLALPTTQLGHHYAIAPVTPDDVTERAFNLAYDQYQSYAGSPDVQAQVLAEAVDDINFYDEVQQAVARIAGTALITPTFWHEGLLVKDETAQPTKAYKIRGATNFILKHVVQAHEAGVITASAGNHGQAVALAAAKIGIEAMVVVPEGTPETKKAGITAQGGRVVVYGQDYAAASHKALEINARQQGLYVPAFNHRDIMAGQATVAHELVQQAGDIQNLVVPTGGGGLLAGVAKYLAVAAPQLQVYGAGITGQSAVETAFLRGNSCQTNPNKFADGVAVAALGDQTWPDIKRHAKGALTVNEALVRRIIGALTNQGHILEGAGAVGLAAATANRQQLVGLTAVIATGGNIDPDVLLACREAAGCAPPQRLTRRLEFSTI